MKYDLIIIGKGISACSAIISLSSLGQRIAVIAPDIRGSFKIGETLSPSSNLELIKLGIYDDFVKQEHLKAYSSFSSWGSGELIEKYVWEAKQKTGWYIDRLKFEDFLWSKALETNFDYKNDKLTSVDFNDQIWHIKTKDRAYLKSDYILDCSGRSAVVARNYSKRKRLDKLVSMYTVLEQSSNLIEPTVASLIESSENGWFYSSLTPDRKLVVAYFTDSDMIPSGITKNLMAWRQFIADSQYTSKRIETAQFEITQLPSTVDASTIVSLDLKINSLLFAGDAVASFDPLSSHGMTTALWSGRKAAEAYMDLTKSSLIKLHNYKKTLYNGIDKYLEEKQKIYTTEHRFSNKPFWNRRFFNN